MTRTPYLLRDLTEVINEANGGGLLQWVVDVVDIHLTLVEKVVEDVDGFHCSGTLLLVAKDQVDPLMEVGTDVVALQSLQFQNRPGHCLPFTLAPKVTETWLAVNGN